MSNNKIYGEISGNKLARLWMIIGLALLLLGIIIAYGGGNVDERDGFLEGLVFEHSNGANYAFVVYAGLIALITAGVISAVMKGMSLMVTDTYVTGSVTFGKTVNLPIHQISSVAMGPFNKLIVATSSGYINFWFIENRDEVYTFLMGLIEKNHSKPVYVENNAPPAASSADELQKYKALLDSGVITQAEFDKKKKQLLGL